LPAIEATFTIRPQLFAAISGIASRIA